jgi:hypothetical protein
VFASFDRGEHWTDLRLGLPHVSVVDMVVHPRDNDLVIATHSRGFYILDDVAPLQQLTKALSRKLEVFRPAEATRYTPASDTSVLGNRVWVAPNKPYGSTVSYYLASRDTAAHITILDRQGHVLQSLSAPAEAGLNRITWNLRESVCEAAPAGGGRRGGRGSSAGPRVLPGEYRVRVQALGETVEETLAVRLDPRIQVSAADLDAYYAEVKRLYGMQCSIDAALVKIGSVSTQLDTVAPHITAADLRQLAASLRKELDTVEVDLEPHAGDPEHLNLRRRLTWLVDQVQNYTGRPTSAQNEWIDTFEAQLRKVLLDLNTVIEQHIPAFNQRLRQANLPPISPNVPTRQ